MESSYQEAVDYIENIGRFSVKNSNAHTRKVLELLGDPDRTFPVIHAAGTNGKGSVCSYMAQIFRTSGRKTGLFTSPHLERINERMQIDGRDISDAEFASVFDRVREASLEMERLGEPHPSYFEFLFLMGMVYFADEHVDIAVIETGLGGRLDATNALEHPLVSVITSIGMDHMQYLGNTIAEIAGEKAGILKAGTPCVFDGGVPEASKVIRKRAEDLAIPAEKLVVSNVKILSWQEGIIDFSMPFRYDGQRIFRIRSAAAYQAENAALAVLAVKTLRKYHSEYHDIGVEQIFTGLLAMFWPARMEEIRPGIYLDGAHNEAGVRKFLESAKHLAGDREAVLLFAVVKDKDYTDMIREIGESGLFRFCAVTEISGTRAARSSEIADLFRKEGIPEVMAIPSVPEAYAAACHEKKDEELLFICGSLYLAGMIEEQKTYGNNT